MPNPFEEPAKAEMRASCEIAIDQAGHELVDKPARIDLSSSASLQSRLKGDLQSLDGEGNRYCYYLRPRAEDALPEWLANLAAATHEVLDVKLYVVVDEASPTFERACRVAGAGLLLLNEDREFQTVLDFDLTLPEAIDAAFRERIDKVRRDLEMKVDLHQTELKGRFERIAEHTRGMTPEIADQYSANVERQYRTWTEWGDKMSARLDAALAARSVDDLEAIERDVDRGPILDDEE